MKITKKRYNDLKSIIENTIDNSYINDCLEINISEGIINIEEEIIIKDFGILTIRLPKGKEIKKRRSYIDKEKKAY